MFRPSFWLILSVSTLASLITFVACGKGQIFDPNSASNSDSLYARGAFLEDSIIDTISTGKFNPSSSSLEAQSSSQTLSSSSGGSGIVILPGDTIPKESSSSVIVISSSSQSSSSISSSSISSSSVSSSSVSSSSVSSSSADQQWYTLTVSGGTGAGSFQSGTNINISATPPAGQCFTVWGGDTQYLADANSASTTVTMPNVNVSVTAGSGACASSSSSGSGCVAWVADLWTWNGTTWDGPTCVTDGGKDYTCDNEVGCNSEAPSQNNARYYTEM